mmetsp:Transcript_42559/g.102545  ORF Transcript_42559/g.102545 Transcript_42559/m.102545 type:complete len:229 (+) Transcript_42559:2257-2943(+)
MDVFVKFKRVGHSSTDQGLNEGHDSEQSDTIDLVDDVVRDAIRLCIPSSRNLSDNPAVPTQSTGHVDLPARLQLNVPRVFLDERLASLSVHLLELVGGLFISNFNRRHVAFQEHTVIERCSGLGIVAPEQFGFKNTDASVCQNILLELRLDVPIRQRLSGLGINPAGVNHRATVSTSHATVEILHVAHHPGHLDAPLDRKLTIGFHLPARRRIAVRSEFPKPSDHHHL